MAESMNQVKFMAIMQASGEVLCNEDIAPAYSKLSGYLLALQKKDPSDQGNWEDLGDEILVWEPYDCLTPLEVMQTIESMAQGIEESMKSVLELAKEGIIQEAIEGRLDSDMNSLDMVGLVEIGYEAQEEQMLRQIEADSSGPRPMA